MSLEKRKRAHIPLIEKLASALADKLPQAERDALREAKVPALQIVRMFTPDHVILHAWGGPDLWWNLTMARRGPELKAKDNADTSRAAKAARIRGETCTGPRREIRSRGFEKRREPFKWPKRKFQSRKP